MYEQELHTVQRVEVLHTLLSNSYCCTELFFIEVRMFSYRKRNLKIYKYYQQYFSHLAYYAPYTVA